MSSLPFLQVGTSAAPVTPRSLVGLPDFSALRHQLTSLSSTAALSSGGLAASVSPIGLTAAMSALRTLVSCEAEEVFGDKASSLRDALVRMLCADFIPREAKDALQSFLQRLEGNCSALKTHKPVVEQYKTLRESIDSYNTNVMGLLDRIDKLEAEFNMLVTAAADLQKQLEVNVHRQEEIGSEQAELHTQSQQLITDYLANNKALVGCQSAYDFSLPVWNAVLLSWEQMKDLITRLPDPPAESTEEPPLPANQPSV